MSHMPIKYARHRILCRPTLIILHCYAHANTQLVDKTTIIDYKEANVQCRFYGFFLWSYTVDIIIRVCRVKPKLHYSDFPDLSRTCLRHGRPSRHVKMVNFPATSPRGNEIGRQVGDFPVSCPPRGSYGEVAVM